MKMAKAEDYVGIPRVSLSCERSMLPIRTSLLLALAAPLAAQDRVAGFDSAPQYRIRQLPPCL
jgi:hypothetical protein